MNLDIVLWPHPVLSEGTEPVVEVDEELRQVVGEMRRLLFRQRGVGLAAPQVGIGRRLMLVCPSGHPGDEFVAINPEIIESTGAEVGEEGCLSFPGLYGMVPRAVSLRVRYQDLDLRSREMEIEGFVARVFQHELDHLNGEVFVDKMVPESRALLEDELTELKRNFAETSA